MEFRCQTCGEKAEVAGFLAAAQQACAKCGNLLMGELDRGTRGVRPQWTMDQPPPQVPLANSPPSATGLCVGMVIGIVAGVGVVVAVGVLGTGLPQHTRGAVLGACSGVLLVPFVMMFSFVSMFMPWSIDGILGTDLWNQIARANNERKYGHLVGPLLFYVVLPMALCGFGGSRMRDIHLLVYSAGLGAAILGAILGSIAGVMIGNARTAR